MDKYTSPTYDYSAAADPCCEDCQRDPCICEALLGPFICCWCGQECDDPSTYPYCSEMCNIDAAADEPDD